MRKVTLDEQKKIEMEIMAYIHDFCMKHSIRYFLAYGSLLGAVRHHGFIPWDDDVDIVLPREDYEVFSNQFNLENHSNYQMINAENRKDYYCPFSKVIDKRTVLHEKCLRNHVEIGVYIDVFPLDRIDRQKPLAMKRLSLYRCIYKVKNYKTFSRSNQWIKRAGWAFLRFLSFFFTNRFLYRRINAIAQGFSGNGESGRGEIAQLTLHAYSKREIHQREWYDTAESCQFENNQFIIPAKYDSILSRIYGDYMTIPPKEKQIPNHTCDVYFR